MEKPKVRSGGQNVDGEGAGLRERSVQDRKPKVESFAKWVLTGPSGILYFLRNLWMVVRLTPSLSAASRNERFVTLSSSSFVISTRRRG